MLNVDIHMQMMVKIVSAKLNFQKNSGKEIGKKKSIQSYVLLVYNVILQKIKI